MSWIKVQPKFWVSKFRIRGQCKISMRISCLRCSKQGYKREPVFSCSGRCLAWVCTWNLFEGFETCNFLDAKMFRISRFIPGLLCTIEVSHPVPNALQKVRVSTFEEII